MIIIEDYGTLKKFTLNLFLIRFSIILSSEKNYEFSDTIIGFTIGILWFGFTFGFVHSNYLPYWKKHLEHMENQLK